MEEALGTVIDCLKRFFFCWTLPADEPNKLLRDLS